jgi:hypothetical protein
VIKHRATHTGWRRLRAYQSTVLCLLKDTRVGGLTQTSAGREQMVRLVRDQREQTEIFPAVVCYL